MGMSTFGLMILLCLLSVCALVNSVSILESSGDLWQNWLLNENEEIPSQQGSPLSRRITPKSVFVAPEFSRCSQGYRLDGMGNCVEIVKLNEAAQWDSVLKILQQMSAQPFTSNKRQSQTSDGEKINNKVSSTNDADSTDTAAGPFQLSIPFDSKNSSESQSLQNDTTTAATTTSTTTSTTENPKEFSTTFRPFFIQSTTVDETLSSQNTHFVDYATEATTDTQEPTTFGGEVDYAEDTESNQYANTESTNTETDLVADSTTQDTVTESVVNVASHSAESDFDKVDPTTQITPHIIKRIPNYHSIVPLKGVANANKPIQQIPVDSLTAAATDSKPFSNYSSGKPNTTVHNTTLVNMAKNPTVHIANSLSNNNNNEDVDGQSANLPSDVFQKLPPGQRTKPKCDSTNKYDCLLQINIFPTNKPMFLLNRKPSSTALVRFPETPTKGFVRFPPQKATFEYDDVALAESNPYRYWDRRYPSTWWTSWKSKPQFIQIVPETSAIYGVADTNYEYIRSHPHFQTQTEWYSK